MVHGIVLVVLGFPLFSKLLLSEMNLPIFVDYVNEMVNYYVVMDAVQPIILNALELNLIKFQKDAGYAQFVLDNH